VCARVQNPSLNYCKLIHHSPQSSQEKHNTSLSKAIKQAIKSGRVSLVNIKRHYNCSEKSISLKAGSKTTRESQGFAIAIAIGLCLFTAQGQHCHGSLPAVTSVCAGSLRPCWRPQAQATVMFSMYTER